MDANRIASLFPSTPFQLQANELSNRYGDYFAASPDPVNACEIWIAGEYHAMPTWSTYIGELHIA